jgi:hypothetical protein
VALIRLTGKHAVGAFTHAIVDDDMLAYLSQWRWKAKPNAGGNNVYAVRNTIRDGKNVTLRMHRIVAGLSHDDPHDVDHDNHNSLDNRRFNLLRATRSENLLNARSVLRVGSCKHCSAPIDRITRHGTTGAMACSKCSRAIRRSARRSSVYFVPCPVCARVTTARRVDRQFCSDRCRCAARRQRRRMCDDHPLKGIG